MTREEEWVKETFIDDKTIEKAVQASNQNLAIQDGRRLLYAYQVRSYTDQEPKEKPKRKEGYQKDYKTDVLVYERKDQKWTPRVVIEAKISEVTTHDVITYSQKAAEHKVVHPYLRYGMLVGNRKDRPLPGLLFRHGSHFDFMVSWKGFEPCEKERKDLINLIVEEVEISRNLEDIFFNSQSRSRAQYTFLHRPLKLK